MEFVCHRCSATLDPDAFYCQNCGSPQVRFVPPDENAEAQSGELSAGRAMTPGSEHGGSVQWKLAIRIAAFFAVGVGILSTLLAAASVLWVVVGAVFAVRAYRRRWPRASLARQVGARIGVLVGLLAAAVALAGNAAFLMIQRYALHQGNLIDTQLTAIVKQAAERAAAMDPQAPIATFTNFWLSAEGRIGLILMTMSFLSGLIILFAVIGGVLGAQIYRSPRGNKALL